MRVTSGMRVRAILAGLAGSLLVLATGGAAGGEPPAHPPVEGALTMEQAVDVALARSLRVRVADADVRTMESMRREALAPFWPQLSANGYFADQRMSPNVYTSAGSTMARNYQVFTADQTRDLNVTAMYPLFAGGRDYYGYKAVLARADAARQMREGTRLDVAMQTRLDYVAALREQANTRVSAELRADVEERLRLTREQFEAGRVPRYYVLRDETELANVLQMDAMAQSRAETALVALKTTLGVSLDSPITLADRLEHEPVAVSIEDGIRLASERHPELRAAGRQREAAGADVRAAYGNYFPQVSIGAMYDWASMKSKSEARTSDDGYSVGVVVTLPIFDGWMREGAVATARARLDRAVQAEALVRQQLAREVTQAALMLGAAERSVAASRKGLEQAEEEYRIVRERFAAGRGIQLEILDAQVSLTRARFNAVAALAEHHTARAMWRKAIGEIR